MRTLVIQRIRLCVKELWKDATVEVFGSFDTKLYLHNGDIDLMVIGIGDREYGKTSDIHALAIEFKRKDYLNLVRYK